MRTLVDAFARIHRERMTDLPIVNPRLRVNALAFDPVDDGRTLQGILSAPWFMSLVHLPVVHEALSEPVGRVVPRRFGARSFDCLVSWDENVGRYDSCALFSPMHEFVDQAHAEQVAIEVLRMLRSAPEVPPASASPASTPPRRRFLLGRGAA